MPPLAAAILAQECVRIAKAMGASHLGIADITRAYEACPDSFAECGKLLTGICIAVAEDDDLLVGRERCLYMFHTL